MTLTLILQAILAVLKFPEQMGNFIRLISDTTEEKRQKIDAQVKAWAKDSAESERPKWE